MPAADAAKALEWAVELRAELQRVANCCAAAQLTPPAPPCPDPVTLDPTEPAPEPAHPTTLPHPASDDRDAVCTGIITWIVATPAANGERVIDCLLGCLTEAFPSSVVAKSILKDHAPPQEVGGEPPPPALCKHLFRLLCRAVTASCADGILRLAAMTAGVSTQLARVWSDELSLPHLAAEVKADRFAHNHRFDPSRYLTQLACQIPSVAEKLQFVEDPARIASLLGDLQFRVEAQPGRAEEAVLREELTPVLRQVFVTHGLLRRQVTYIYRALCTQWGATAVPKPTVQDAAAHPPSVLAAELFSSQAFADCLSFLTPGLAASVAGDPAALVEACAEVVKFVGEHNRTAAGWLVVQPTLQKMLHSYKHYPSRPLRALLLQVSPLIPHSASVEELLLALPTTEDEEYEMYDAAQDAPGVALSPKKDEIPSLDATFNATNATVSTPGMGSPQKALSLAELKEEKAARAELRFLAASLRMRGVPEWEKRFAEACGFATILEHLQDRGAGEAFHWDPDAAPTDEDDASDYATRCAVTGRPPRTLTPFYLSIGLGLMRDALAGLPSDMAPAAVNEFTASQGIDILLTEWRRAHPLMSEQQQQAKRARGAGGQAASPLHRLSMLNMLKTTAAGLLPSLAVRITGAIDDAVAGIFAFLLQHDTAIGGCRKAIAQNDTVVLVYLAEEAAFAARGNTLWGTDAVTLLRALLLRPVGDVLVAMNKLPPHQHQGAHDVPPFRIPVSASICQLHDLLVREDTGAAAAPSAAADIVKCKRAEAHKVVAQTYLRQNIGGVVCRVMVAHALPEPEEARLASCMACLLEAGFRPPPDQAMLLAGGLLDSRSASAMRLLAVLFRHFSAEEIAVVCGGKRAAGATPLHSSLLFDAGVARLTLRYDEESLSDFEHWLMLLSCFAATGDEAEQAIWARGVLHAAQLRLQLLPNHLNYKQQATAREERPPKLQANSPLHPESFLFAVGGGAPEIAWEARRTEVLRGLHRLGAAHAEASVDKRDLIYGLGYMEQALAEYEQVVPHLGPVRKVTPPPDAAPGTPPPARIFPPVPTSPTPRSDSLAALPQVLWASLGGVSAEGAALIAALRAKGEKSSWRGLLVEHRVAEVWACKIDEQRQRNDGNEVLLLRFCNVAAQVLAYLATSDGLPLLNAIGRVLAAIALDDLYGNEEAAVTALDATLNFVTAHPDDLQMSGVLFSAILALYEFQQTHPEAIPASLKPRLSGIFAAANIDWNAARDALHSDDEPEEAPEEEEEEEEEPEGPPPVDPHAMSEAEYLEHLNANAYYDMLTQRLLEKRPACGGNPLQTIKELKLVLEELETAREKETAEEDAAKAANSDDEKSLDGVKQAGEASPEEDTRGAINDEANEAKEAEQLSG
eukprot:TRINITY_DN1924_c0_g2_i1.p1 TRINITY_DN1924_c0_g2~~TRINITY_DN1924_c0_g2_i1.p1  ORF type:complete len:1458 (+),score=373.95 TRINITY_DN1924_c0_g2_i1:249-4376(+)